MSDSIEELTATLRNGFRLIVEIDGAEIEAVNRKLKALGDVRAANAMRNGFRKWTKRVATIAKAMIPQGKAAPTEKVRGEVRPNPHIRDFVTTKVVGYSRGKVIWAAVGVKELRAAGLTATAISRSQIDLSWSAATVAMRTPPTVTLPPKRASIELAGSPP